MAGRVGRNDRQREFVKEYDALCYHHNRHEVWQDFVWLIAASIANLVDRTHADKREERYMSIISKYKKHEQEVFPKLFALIVQGMDEQPDQDFLGELYMALELGNDHAGQFFTPYDVCKCMAKITVNADYAKQLIKERGYISVNDCACGAGATLVAAAMVMKEQGINYQQSVIFVGQDIDYTVGLMCYIQLSLLGCAGYVHIGNTITNPMTGHVLYGDGGDATWYTPMFFADSWCMRREVEKVKKLFRAFEAPAEPIPAKPDSTITESQEPMETQLQSLPKGAAPESLIQPSAVAEGDFETSGFQTSQEKEPVFIVSTRKKDAGQLMFDFGV